MGSLFLPSWQSVHLLGLTGSHFLQRLATTPGPWGKHCTVDKQH